MNEHLLRYKPQQKYLFFDYETESVNLAQHNKPWQIGYAIADGYKIHKMVNKYIDWPDLDISADAARVTKFDRYAYDTNKEEPLKILNEFERYLNNPEYIVVGHNILGFDIFLHNLYRKKLGLPPNFSYLDRAIDTNSVTKAYKLGVKQMDIKNVYIECLRYTNYMEKGLKSSLKLIAREVGLEFDEERLHDAGADVALNYEVFKKLIWMIEI